MAGVVATFLALLGAKDDFVMWARGRDVVGPVLCIGGLCFATGRGGAAIWGEEPEERGGERC